MIASCNIKLLSIRLYTLAVACFFRSNSYPTLVHYFGLPLGFQTHESLEMFVLCYPVTGETTRK